MDKKLGQHFLKNKGAIKKIIDALDLQINDTVIEIGPGAGALTFPLLEKCQMSGIKCQVIAIEKDKNLAKNLELRIRNNEGVKIVIGDALKELPTIIRHSSFKIQNYKVVGNIPYYITGKLLRTISELESKPARTVLMIQKEVAERIIAKPPKMNLLAAATQFWAEPKILFSLKPNDFDPPPKVNSAVIQLIPEKIPDSQFQISNYYRLLHIIFKQPRKTLANNLSAGLGMPKEAIENRLKRSHIDKNARPQDLSLEEIKMLVADFHS